MSHSRQEHIIANMEMESKMLAKRSGAGPNFCSIANTCFLGLITLFSFLTMVYVREGVFSTATEYKSLKNQLLSAVESKNLKKQFTSLADDFAIVKDQFFSAATEYTNLKSQFTSLGDHFAIVPPVITQMAAQMLDTDMARLGAFCTAAKNALFKAMPQRTSTEGTESMYKVVGVIVSRMEICEKWFGTWDTPNKTDATPNWILTRIFGGVTPTEWALNQFNEEDMRKFGTVCSNVAENLKKVPWNSAFTSYDYVKHGALWHRTQKSQYVFDILDTYAEGGGLSGTWFSVETATGHPNGDRYEFRREGERYYIIRPPGGAFLDTEYFTFDGTTVRHVDGPTATLLSSGDLHWDLEGGKWLSRREEVFDTSLVDVMMYTWNNMQTVCDDLKTYTVLSPAASRAAAAAAAAAARSQPPSMPPTPPASPSSTPPG